MTRAGGYGHPEESSLIPSGHFEYSNRPHRDRFWGALFVVCLGLTIAGGVYGIIHRNPNFSQLVDHDYLQNPAHCPYHQHGRRLSELDSSSDFDAAQFLRQSVWWLFAVVAASFGLGFAFLLLLKHQPHAMVYTTIGVQVALPLLAGLAALLGGQTTPGLVMLFVGALAAITFYLWREQIELCARLLKVSADGLNDNPGLFAFVLLLNVVLALALLPLVAMLGAAYMNGSVQPNSARQGHSQCIDSEGHSVTCCVWQPDNWAVAYLSLGPFTMLWTIMLAAEVRIYVIAGVIAQWYFKPQGAGGAARGATMRSVKHALGPSFGSLSLGSLVLTLVQMARQALEKAKERRAESGGESLLVTCAGLLLQCVYALIEFITKFATVRMAITGEAFFAAGRSATSLLARNFLKTYGVWWFPPMVLNLGSFALSVVGAAAIYGLSYLTFSRHTNAVLEAGIVGGLSFLLSLVVLLFFSGVLLNVIDAVYMCYAMDKDTQAVTRVEVHQVFAQVPVGAIVEQPGGEIHYGAPTQHQGGYPQPGQNYTYPQQQPYAAPGFAPPGQYAAAHPGQPGAPPLPYGQPSAYGQQQPAFTGPHGRDAFSNV